VWVALSGFLFCYAVAMPTNDPRKNEKLSGAVTFWSNSPGVPTGYGVQSKLVVERLKRHGLEVAALSNYGLDGRFEDLNTASMVIATMLRPVITYIGQASTRI